eukprot:1488783-Rhodomonas_salina.1
MNGARPSRGRPRSVQYGAGRTPGSTTRARVSTGHRIVNAYGRSQSTGVGRYLGSTGHCIGRRTTEGSEA